MPGPLTATEQKQLIALLTKAGGATLTRTPKTGSRYQALSNLSVPRPDGQTDLVIRGNPVTLTDDEAALFMPPNKPFPMIRKMSDSAQPLPFLHPRQHWGAARGIPGPMAQGGPMEQGGARVDPPGSTKVMIQVPEGNEPKAGTENLPPGLAESLGLKNDGNGGQSFDGPDALDIPPSG